MKLLCLLFRLVWNYMLLLYLYGMMIIRFEERGMRNLAVLVAAMAVAGCSYKIEITQGNPKLLDDFAQVQVGMSQAEVEAILQTAQLKRLYKKNTWYYVYEQRDSGFVGEYKIFSAELVFNNAGNLAEINILKNSFADDAADDTDEEDASDDGDGSDGSDDDSAAGEASDDGASDEEN